MFFWLLHYKRDNNKAETKEKMETTAERGAKEVVVVPVPVAVDVAPLEVEVAEVELEVEVVVVLE